MLEVAVLFNNAQNQFDQLFKDFSVHSTVVFIRGQNVEQSVQNLRHTLDKFLLGDLFDFAQIFAK